MDAPKPKLCHEKIDMRKPKVYHKDGMNTIGFQQTYFSCDIKTGFGEETLHFFMKKIHDALAAGNFKGTSAYDFSVASLIHQLYTVCDYYPEITILKLNDTCIMELNKWLAMRTGAFDWSHAHNYVKGLHRTSEDLNKEDNLKTCIKRVLKFDLHKANITELEVLEQADCIITSALLEVISQDQNDYTKNFQSIMKLLKPGGLLILLGCLNASYYKVGKDTYHVFTYDECFLRQKLADEGFNIDSCEVLDRKIQSDLTDYKQFIVITAIKENMLSRLR